MGYWKTACSCGAVSVEIDGEPAFVNACACLECQKASGSAFSYTAFFEETVFKAEGQTCGWTTFADNGYQVEVVRCATCGVNIYTRLQSVPGMLSIPVGLLGDPDFPAPANLYWAKRKHHWVGVAGEIGVHDEQ